MLARPTIENLILFGKNMDRPMLEVGYSDMIALLVLAGEVVAFPALTPAGDVTGACWVLTAVPSSCSPFPAASATRC